MARVRRHRRKAYRRKDGTRVRASDVRSHYRRDPRRRAGLRRKRQQQAPALASLLRWLGSIAREANQEHQQSARRRAVHEQEQAALRRRKTAMTAKLICTPSWQGRVTQHLSSTVDSRLWAQRLHRCSIDECRDLAKVAKALLDFHSIARIVPGDALYRRRMSREPQTFHEELAHHLYTMFSASARVGMVKAAKCLQVMGILCCLTAERDLEDCQCLQDLGHDVAMDQLEAVLVDMADAGSWRGSDS